MKQTKTLDLAQLALLATLVVLLAFVPYIGYIRIPILAIQATTIHIPVIIGSILLGPKAGGILGGIFGLTSLINNQLVSLGCHNILSQTAWLKNSRSVFFHSY